MRFFNSPTVTCLWLRRAAARAAPTLYDMAGFSGEESQWVGVVLDIFATGTNCNFSYCGVGEREEVGGGLFPAPSSAGLSIKEFSH